MVSDTDEAYDTTIQVVLILVVMEDGLWRLQFECNELHLFRVLILVLMEDGLWPA